MRGCLRALRTESKNSTVCNAMFASMRHACPAGHRQLGPNGIAWHLLRTCNTIGVLISGCWAITGAGVWLLAWLGWCMHNILPSVAITMQQEDKALSKVQTREHVHYPYVPELQYDPQVEPSESIDMILLFFDC